MTERNDPAFYRVRELIKEWGWYVRKDNRYETMYKKQPFIDGQAGQCLLYIQKYGSKWWHKTYKPRLLKSWGADRVKQVTNRMNERRTS